MKVKIIKDISLIGLVIIITTIWMIFGCTKPEKNIIYGPNNPDPYAAHYNVAILDSIQPRTAYPTDEVTILGSGFDTSTKDHFVWFDLAKAKVKEVWTDSLLVEVPLPNPANPDYFFDDTVDVKVALYRSYSWSNTIPFVFKPMAQEYAANIYPDKHTEDKFTSARGMAFDAEGNVYLMNQRTRSIYKDTPGGERTVFSFGGYFDGGMRIGPDGYLYAAGNTKNIIYRIPPGGNSFEQWATVPNPWGMDFDQNGNLFIIDKGNGHLYRVSSQGTVEKVAELPGTEEKAYCRVFDGNVYANANGSASGFILKLPITETGVGSVDTVDVEAEGLINDLTFSSDGSIYFIGSGANIYKYDTSGELNTLVTLSGDLGFITWREKFLYISNMTGSTDINDHVYKVMIHDCEAAVYYGR